VENNEQQRIMAAVTNLDDAAAGELIERTLWRWLHQGLIRLGNFCG
jgi:hypothetical protein